MEHDKLLMCLAKGIAKHFSYENETADPNELFEEPHAIHMLECVAEALKGEFELVEK